MKTNNGYDADAVTRRLQIVRYLAAGDNQAAWARKLEISRTRWNNYERGYPITIKLAYAITNVVDGVTIGWLIAGEENDLKVAIRNQLLEAEASLFPERKAAKAPRAASRASHKRSASAKA